MNPTVITLSVLPPSVNNLFPGNGKRRFMSNEYKSWKTAAGWELLSQRPLPVMGKVELLFQFAEPKTNHRRDVSNLCKATEDLLVSHGVIEGDDQRFVRRVIAEWSEDLPGVIITITPLGKALGGRGEVLAQPGSLR